MKICRLTTVRAPCASVIALLINLNLNLQQLLEPFVSFGSVLDYWTCLSLLIKPSNSCHFVTLRSQTSQATRSQLSAPPKPQGKLKIDIDSPNDFPVRNKLATHAVV